jgi:hypothetical protein
LCLHFSFHERSQKTVEQPTFQWSVFSADRSQQWVVRAETFEEFLQAVRQMKVLLPGEAAPEQSALPGVNGAPEEQAHVGEVPPPTQPIEQLDFCAIHQKPMVLRTGKNGQWYDHRWQENGVWRQCNGKQARSNAAGGSK